MAHCTNCGSDVTGAGRFCAACGALVAVDSFPTQTVASSQPHLVTTPRDSRHTSSSSRSRGRFAPGELLGGRYRIVDMIGKRSEEHTSELQSRGHLVCRLLLEKKK